MHTQKKDRDFAKTKRVTVRMTEDEYDLLTDYCEKSGYTHAAYLRNALLAKIPPVKYEIVYNSPEILKIFSNLGNMAGNMNQIARHLNRGGALSREQADKILGCITEIRHLREELKARVGEYRGNS